MYSSPTVRPSARESFSIFGRRGVETGWSLKRRLLVFSDSNIFGDVDRAGEVKRGGESSSVGTCSQSSEGIEKSSLRGSLRRLAWARSKVRVPSAQPTCQPGGGSNSALGSLG